MLDASDGTHTRKMLRLKKRGKYNNKQLLTTIGDGSLAALRVAIRVEYKLVQDTSQTTTNDGSEPINL